MYVSAINGILSLSASLVLHEMGHFFAARLTRVPVIEAGLGWGPKLLGVKTNGVDYQLRLLPLGAYIRMDISALQKRPLFQQLFVLLAGIAVNLILAAISWGTFFGTLNLVLALANLFPIYQQDGWKIGMVIFRRIFKRRSPVVEWSFTLYPALVGLAVLLRLLF